ncbi:MAG: DNA polymerase III subunit delta [Candidatus Saccharimonadota bacterium]
MITWLVGENSFEIREELRAIEARFDGRAEKIDGTELSLSQLPDLLMGTSLFATERLVVITDISKNSSLWEKLPEWLKRISDTIHVVFVDEKPDKRTTSYKALKQAAELKEFLPWGERDEAKAIEWVKARAEQEGVTFDTTSARHLVRRVGLDQWQLAHAITTLGLLDTVTLERIDSVIPQNLQENIFQLFETALEGKPEQVASMIKTLALQEDPYALFALLTSQAMALAAVTCAGDDDAPAKDFAIHPFVASKMSRHARSLGRARVAYIVELFAKTDADMKRSRGEPWLLIEKLLVTIGQ